MDARDEVGIPENILAIDLDDQGILPAFWNSHVHFAEPEGGSNSCPQTGLMIC